MLFLPPCPLRSHRESTTRSIHTAQRLMSLKRHHPRVRQPSAAMSCKQCGACMARLGRPQRVRAHATAAQSPGVRLHIAPGVRSRGSSWRAPRATGPQCLRCAACRGWRRPAPARATRQGPPSRTSRGSWSTAASHGLMFNSRGATGKLQGRQGFFLPGEGPAKSPRQFLFDTFRV